MVQVSVQNTLSPEYLHSESNHKVFRRIIVLWCNDGIFAAKIRKTTLNLFVSNLFKAYSCCDDALIDGKESALELLI